MIKRPKEATCLVCGQTFEICARPGDTVVIAERAPDEGVISVGGWLVHRCAPDSASPAPSDEASEDPSQ